MTPSANEGMSAWYWHGLRLRRYPTAVFEHSPRPRAGPESDMMRTRPSPGGGQQGGRTGAVRPHPITCHAGHMFAGDADGPAAGLMMTLAYIDLLTPGALVGDMRVAGTGGIRPDGLAFPVKAVDVKVATAMLTQPDVIFVTKPPMSVENVTIVESQKERIPADGYTRRWLHFAALRSRPRRRAIRGSSVVVVMTCVSSGVAVRTTDGARCAH